MEGRAASKEDVLMAASLSTERAEDAVATMLSALVAQGAAPLFVSAWSVVRGRCGTPPGGRFTGLCCLRDRGLRTPPAGVPISKSPSCV